LAPQLTLMDTTGTMMRIVVNVTSAHINHARSSTGRVNHNGIGSTTTMPLATGTIATVIVNGMSVRLRGTPITGRTVAIIGTAISVPTRTIQIIAFTANVTIVLMDMLHACGATVTTSPGRTTHPGTSSITAAID
jgi:hypothetical protein